MIAAEASQAAIDWPSHYCHKLGSPLLADCQSADHPQMGVCCFDRLLMSKKSPGQAAEHVGLVDFPLLAPETGHRLLWGLYFPH